MMDVDALSSVKVEEDSALHAASPSQSPTLVADVPAQKLSSRSPTPLAIEPTMDDSAPSTPKSSTPPQAKEAKQPRKPVAAPIQLIGDLPIARAEALATFTEILDNNYQFKSLGRSREILESMTCDCTYEHGTDNEDNACGPYSDCINRLTQVECLLEDCRCRNYCQNQRFQRKQYGNIDIVQTEKKGFGLRAEEDLPKDSFIYEYVGDVVNPASFKRRMREYAEEGIRHFYFMMLQKDEFIDATKSGGIGRFANHSCNPNCYVAKWTVGTHVRMGIFAKRNIKMHEELTFNYNVDRYGHQAQECFCGEPNCVGYIGGKTQTDIATMDDLYLDALGITDEDELSELKGTKKKKGKKIDDPDFMPTMKPVAEKEVPKVIQAIRQTSSKKVLSKLLTRIRITEDAAVLRQIMRLRGYSLMTNVLEDNPQEFELIRLVLECMTTWPLLNKNKVQDSKVHVPVEACKQLADEKIQSLATKLLEHWETLPVYTRIPKRRFQESERDTTVYPHLPQVPPDPRKKPDRSTPQKEAPTAPVAAPPKVYPKPDAALLLAKQQEMAFRAAQMSQIAAERDRKKWMAQEAETRRKIKEAKEQRDRQFGIIVANARREAEALELEAKMKAKQAEEAAAALAEKAERAQKRKEKKARKEKMTPEEKEALKEKRLTKLIGPVVVKCMSKYAKGLDREQFKKYARELTQTIAEKEKKSASYKENRLDALSEEKVAKIKKFSKEYIAKVLRKLEKSGKHHHRSSRPSIPSTPSSSSVVAPSTTSQCTPSTSTHTPDQDENGDVQMGDESMMMSLEEAMGLDESDDDDDAEGDDNDETDSPTGVEEKMADVDVNEIVVGKGKDKMIPPQPPLWGDGGEVMSIDVRHPEPIW